jgi:prepilin signal peptidase PulO-like enzyme (type II secretory pathway)
LFVIIFWQQMTIVDYNVLMLSCFHVLMLSRNWIFTAFLIIIFLYDLKYYLILDTITVPAMIFALIINIFLSFLNIQYPISNILISISWFLVSALALGLFFLLQFLISRGRWLGGGDIRLGVLMGLMLGWPNSLTALILGYILGSLIGIILIVLKKKTMRSQVPLGTFLTVTTFVALMWGQEIAGWYLKLTF